VRDLHCLHNERMLSSVPRSARTLVVVAAAAALTVSGCTSGPDSPSASSRSSAPGSASPSASSTVPVPAGVTLTDQGTRLRFRQPAAVVFEPRRNRGSVVRLTVQSVQRASLSDFRGFILDDRYKRRAAYYYVRVTLRNVGDGNVGGAAVPLWGVNAANTLLPPVSFTTPFAPCPSRRLPARFVRGARLRTCLVFLSPDRGALTSISYRPSQRFDPITWTGVITAPAKKPAKKPDAKKPARKATKKPGEKAG
jgi:hypothetical protein